MLVLYFFRFTLLGCGEKNILANLANSQELEPEPVGAGCCLVTWSRSRLGADKDFAGSPALVFFHDVNLNEALIILCDTRSF